MNKEEQVEIGTSFICNDVNIDNNNSYSSFFLFELGFLLSLELVNLLISSGSGLLKFLLSLKN